MSRESIYVLRRVVLRGRPRGRTSYGCRRWLPVHWSRRLLSIVFCWSFLLCLFLHCLLKLLENRIAYLCRLQKWVLVFFHLQRIIGWRLFDRRYKTGSSKKSVCGLFRETGTGTRYRYRTCQLEKLSHGQSLGHLDLGIQLNIFFPEKNRFKCRFLLQF